MRRRLLWSSKMGEGAVASGELVSMGRVARLERDARLAGECFGHEEPVHLARLNLPPVLGPRWLARLATGFTSTVGSFVPGLR